MSYYWFNRENLKNAQNKYHNKGGKQKLPNITKNIQT